MAVRRLAEHQPDSFAFSDANRAWAEREIAKYPEGRQASAVISLLWRAQEQEGWVTEPAIRVVAGMLDMPRIRVLEVATFYTMFHLEPVGRIAHFQVCGTTPCWLAAPTPSRMSAAAAFIRAASPVRRRLFSGRRSSASAPASTPRSSRSTPTPTRTSPPRASAGSSTISPPAVREARPADRAAESAPSAARRPSPTRRATSALRRRPMARAHRCRRQKADGRRERP